MENLSFDFMENEKNLSPLEKERWEKLSNLKERIKTLQNEELWVKGAKLVFGRGSLTPKWMIVGEAPGATEDLKGEPFVGASGKLLSACLKEAGLKEEEAYVCNILKFRPPNNRRPTAEEMEFCRPFLEEQISILQPKYILSLGTTALSFFEERKIEMLKERGKFRFLHRSVNESILLLPSIHPSYVLQFRSKMPLLLEDLRLLKEKMEECS